MCFACYELYSGPTLISASDLDGRLVLDQSPVSGAEFELHRAITFTSQEVSARGVKYDSTILKRGSTDKEGRFSLGSTGPGKYWLILTKPSHEQFAIEVGPKLVSFQKERLLIVATADWCTQVKVERFSFGRLQSSDPTSH
jgi:hypothetical protein